MSISLITNNVMYGEYGNPTRFVTDKFAGYIKDHCPGHVVSQVEGWLLKNRELMQHFKNFSENSIPIAERKEYFLAFAWGLMAAAVERNEGFTQGTFKFEDAPNHRIVEFFRPIAYLRPSSHYRGRVAIKTRAAWLFNAYAIDDDRLPAQHRTAIFAPVKTLHEAKSYSFLKIESHSAHPLRPLQFFMHFLDYLKTRPRAYHWESRCWSIFRDANAHSYREEDMPKELKEEFLDIVNKAPKTDVHLGCLRAHPQAYVKAGKSVRDCVQKFGIAGLWTASYKMMDIAGEQVNQGSNEEDRKAWDLWGKKVELLRNRLEHLYPQDVHVRKGREVVLPSSLR